MQLADDSRFPEHPPAPSLRLPQDISRDGSLLRLKSGTPLPPRCIYCNAPVETASRKIRISSASALDLTLPAHLCEGHRLAHVQVIVTVIGTLLMTASAAGFAWLRGAGWLIVLAILAVGLLGTWLRGRMVYRRTPRLRLDRTEGEFLYLSGASPDFLDMLPRA